MDKKKVLILVLVTISTCLLLGITLFISRTPEPQTDQARISYLFTHIGCPTCNNQNLELAPSTNAIAQDLKLEIIRLVSEGKSNSYITNYLESKYGSSIILSSPTNSLIVLLGILLGAIFASSLFYLAFIKLRKGLQNTLLSKTKTPGPKRLRKLAGNTKVGLAGVALILLGIIYLVLILLGFNIPGAENKNGNIPIAQELTLAQKLAATNNQQLAIFLYSQILKTDPDEPIALAQQGYLISQVGSKYGDVALINSGKQEISKAIKVSPNLAQAYLYLGTIYAIDLNNYQKASRCFEQFLKYNHDKNLLNSARDLLLMTFQKAKVPVPDRFLKP